MNFPSEEVNFVNEKLWLAYFCLHFRKVEEGKYRGYFWGLDQVFTREFKCVSVQGLASILKPFLLKTNARWAEIFLLVLLDFNNFIGTTIQIKQARNEAQKGRMQTGQ